MAKDKHTEVEVAERRAAIASYLEQHPGEHAPVDVATAVGQHVTGVGLILKQMADSKLIDKPRVDHGKKLYHWGTPRSADLNSAGTAPKRSYVKKVKPQQKTDTSDQFSNRTFVRLEGAEMSFPIGASPDVIGATVAATLLALKTKVR